MELPLRCACGKVIGRLLTSPPQKAERLVCMCCDCQAFAHHLGRGDELLDRHGGTEVVPATPARIRIDAGHEHIACTRLSPKGLMRWHTSCCKTSMANTLPSPNIPFAGVVHTFIDYESAPGSADDLLGPVRARVQARYGHGPFEEQVYARAPLRIIIGSAAALLGAWRRGEAKPSPFADAGSQEPVVEPTVITLAERERLRERVQRPPHED